VSRPVLLSYAAFVLIGVKVGVTGVLLLAQMQDYGVTRAAIGITFFTSSAGYVLGSLSAGPLVSRFGFRIALATGGGSCLAGGLSLATRPPFPVFAAVPLVIGYGTGTLESALNAYIAALDGATTRLNRLHAFFGAGALLGPLLAAWITGFASWTVVWVVLAAAWLPLIAGFLTAYPRRAGVAGATGTAWDTAGTAGTAGDTAGTAAATGLPEATGAAAGRLLTRALRERSVLLGAAMLCVYVGVEIGVGNWGFSYLVQARALPASLAGYFASGYWLGLTIGRFVISPVAARLGASTAGMMYTCLAGITAATLLAWLSPAAPLAGPALVLLGFFLGPVFPTTVAITARLTPAALVPTAIGVMNAAAMVGGSALPWLAGLLAQRTGIWTLLPFAVALSVLQAAIWRPIASRIRLAVYGTRLGVERNKDHEMPD
jgi:fucose permease